MRIPRLFQKSKGRLLLSLLFVLIIIYNFHFLINTDVYSYKGELDNSDRPKTAHNKSKSTNSESLSDFVNEISQTQIDHLLKLIQLKEAKHFNNKANKTFATRLGCFSFLRAKSILKNQNHDLVENSTLTNEIKTYLKLDRSSNLIFSTSKLANHYKNISKFYTFTQPTPKLKFEPLNSDYKKVTILIAGWEKHYLSMKTTIIMLREHFPKLNLIVYDLGLVNNTNNEIKRLCKCDFRKFDSDRLYRNISAHISDLRTFSWRPLIIQEALKDFETVIYLWLPTRIKSNKIKQVVDRTKAVGGFLSAYNRINLNCYTDHRMYNWFDPTNNMSIQLQNVSSLDEEVMIFRRNLMTSLVVKAWISCAIEEECIAPRGVNMNCTIEDWMKCKCHRFDQSALNVLMTYFYGFPRNLLLSPAFALTPDIKFIFDSISGPLSKMAKF